LRTLGDSVETRDRAESFSAFEEEFQELLFRMVRRPLFEMLTRVTLGFPTTREPDEMYRMHMDVDRWREGRKRIINAILANDPALARFEADRHNRAVVLTHLARHERPPASSPVRTDVRRG
jgi:DNA-binding GntR family transcriptional regulator